MPRIKGIDIPDKKPIWISLTYIPGIGKFTSKKILGQANVELDVKSNKLSEDELSKITQIIDNDHIVGGQLRRHVAQNITRLKEIKCYRGVRHIRGLPVHGQCTQSNARTRKGPRKTVAGKKGVKEMR